MQLTLTRREEMHDTVMRNKNGVVRKGMFIKGDFIQKLLWT